MDLVLTWDLFVVVFFAIVIAYSFIIGKHQSVKVIVSTYIAVVAGQGLGTFLANSSPYSKQLLSSYGLTIDITLLGGAKLLIFITTIIFIAARGGLEIHYAKDSNTITDLAITGLFGFATAGLLLSTLLTFVADASLLDPNLAISSPLTPLITQSPLLAILVIYQGLWYALPALLLIIVGFISHEAE